MIKLAPSILSADFANLERDILKIKDADYVHVDVMDGHFVPNISIGAPVVKALRRVTKMPLDVHLMISEPSKYIPDFIKAGADIITVHIESEGDVSEQIDMIKSAGLRASVSIKPKTPAEELLPLLPKLDMVLVMTVEPGFGGQSFIEDTIPKIRFLRKVINEKGYACELETDGGINEKNIADTVKYGSDVIVAGSAVYGKPNVEETVRRLKSIAAEAEASL